MIVPQKDTPYDVCARYSLRFMSDSPISTRTNSGTLASLLFFSFSSGENVI